MAEDTHGMQIPLPADSTPIAKYPAVARQMGERVAEILAGGITPGLESAALKAAAAAVSTELKNAEIMRGKTSVPFTVNDTAWRQVTENGDFLPLGYTAGGRLDSFARQIFREDITRTTEISRHPVYARVWVTDNDDLLAGLRWDGTIDIPGLPLPAPADPAPPAQPSWPQPGLAGLPVYSDAPYTPGSDILPMTSNPLSWSMWGSSSAEGIAPEMAAAARKAGATYTNGGKGGEWSFQIAARLGSVPALLTFPDNSVPASGSVAVITSIDTNASSMLAYSGTVQTTAGEIIAGTLAYSGGSLRFSRKTAGTAQPIAPETPFTPDLGNAARGDTVILWMGKGNAGEVERVISETAASFDFLAPLVKRCLVLGHFVNTGKTAGDTGRPKIQAINRAYAARYGAAYLDIGAYLTGSQVWVDTGITPTAEDLAEQKLGNKPPSLSMDLGHLNDAADAAVSNLIIQRMRTLGWLPAAQL